MNEKENAPFLLKTKRLIITPFTLEDASFILMLVTTPTWLQFIGDKGVKNVQDAEQYLLNGPMASYKTNGFGLYKVSLHDTTPIGMCGLVKRSTLDYTDIGFAILPAYAGCGYTYEAACAVMEFARDHLKLTTLAGVTTEDNAASVKTLLKLGLHHVKNLRFAPDNREMMLFLKHFEP